MSCNCSVSTAKEVVEKVKAKGVDILTMDYTYNFKCQCGNDIEMTTHLVTCDKCDMQFAVTPCKSDDINNVVSYKA